MRSVRQEQESRTTRLADVSCQRGDALKILAAWCRGLRHVGKSRWRRIVNVVGDDLNGLRTGKIGFGIFATWLWQRFAEPASGSLFWVRLSYLDLVAVPACPNRSRMAHRIASGSAPPGGLNGHFIGSKWTPADPLWKSANKAENDKIFICRMVCVVVPRLTPLGPTVECFREP